MVFFLFIIKKLNEIKTKEIVIIKLLKIITKLLKTPLNKGKNGTAEEVYFLFHFSTVINFPRWDNYSQVLSHFNLCV